MSGRKRRYPGLWLFPKTGPQDPQDPSETLPAYQAELSIGSGSAGMTFTIPRAPVTLSPLPCSAVANTQHPPLYGI